MAKPSQVIVLNEDKRQQQLIRRYLRRIGIEPHAMRFELPSSGSGEQWVREQFPIEVEAYRRRSSRAETKLIAVIDADNLTLLERIEQLDRKLTENGLALVREEEQIVRLVPRRNIETWILCLNEIEIDEETNYKKHHHDWATIIPLAVTTLYAWTRAHVKLPNTCTESLQHGINELRKLSF